MKSLHNSLNDHDLHAARIHVLDPLATTPLNQAPLKSLTHPETLEGPIEDDRQIQGHIPQPLPIACLQGRIS